jgi:hypothetical protein
MGNLKIVSVGEIKEAKDGRKYFAVELRGSLGSRSGIRNIFQQFKRDPKTGLPTAEKVWDRGSREEFMAAMMNHETLDGAKVTRTVEPYQIPGNEAVLTSYSTIVFADEKIESVFAQANHPILDEQTGELIGAKKKVVLATAPTSAVEETVGA